MSRRGDNQYRDREGAATLIVVGALLCLAGCSLRVHVHLHQEPETILEVGEQEPPEAETILEVRDES
ncbi:MAG: hypothetical protein ABIF82_12165 [Planctomycetota bacterium]